MAELCHCGKPLHYRDHQLQEMVEGFVKTLGESIKVTDSKTGRAFLVQRHYIALHGLKTEDLTSMGFKEAP